MEGFDAAHIDVGATTIFARVGGHGPPLLLLHGFPQTHLMWRAVAPVLARTFTVVCADLRGYGHSGCPVSTADHAPYAKRAMARDMLSVMEKLGFEAFSVAGHDRGGRVAYRLALDHPGRVTRLAVLDIVPTSSAWDRADAQFALAFWPWVLLAQPEPLPESLLAAAPAAVIDDALSAWGSSASSFPQEVRKAYIDALRDRDHIHAICEEYRAAATLDCRHDQEDRAMGRKITCPVMALWSGGALDSWYDREGGPLALWRQFAIDVRGHRMDGGHFFPEECPKETIDVLKGFFSDGTASP